MGELINFKTFSSTTLSNNVDFFAFLPTLKLLKNNSIVFVIEDEDLVNFEKFNNLSKILIILKSFKINPILIPAQSFSLKSNFENLLKLNSNLSKIEQIDILEMIFIAKIGRQIQYYLNINEGKSILFTGKDANLIRSKQKETEENFYNLSILNESEIYGVPETLNKESLLSILNTDLIPIILPISLGKGSKTYFCNPIDFATFIAVELKSSNIFFTNSFKNFNFEKSLLSNTNAKINLSKINESSKNYTLLSNAIFAIENNVQHVHFIDITNHNILNELCLINNQGILLYNDK